MVRVLRYPLTMHRP